MTYSIVARDPETGEVGIGVQTHALAVGSLCPWAEPGVGAVATQAMVEVAHGPRILRFLAEGAGAAEALAASLALDPGAAQRQVAVVDNAGGVASHTGASCIGFAGGDLGPTWAAQGNMLLNDETWQALGPAYEVAEAAGLAMPERILRALDAAESHGGDVRGGQSAALLVVAGEASDAGRAGRLLDLRVDDAVKPLADLRRLLDKVRANERLGDAQNLVLQGDHEGAASILAEVQEVFGANLEPTFWVAAVQLLAGEEDQAVVGLAACKASRPAWLDLLRRLPETGVLPLTAEQVDDALARLR